VQSVPRVFLLWCATFFLLQLVLFSTLRLELEERVSPHHGRYFFWFATPALLLAVGCLRHLVSRAPASRWLVLAVVAGQAGFYGHTWAGWLQQNRQPTNLGRDPIRRMLAEAVPPNRVIASNQPQMLVWYSGLKSVSLPADPAELDKLNRRSRTPVDYLFLDLDYNSIQLDPRWSTFVMPGQARQVEWESHLLRDYEYALPPGRTRPLLYVLLRRRGLPPSRIERALNPLCKAGRPQHELQLDPGILECHDPGQCASLGPLIDPIPGASTGIALARSAAGRRGG
jgi:hypothetical protein